MITSRIGLSLALVGATVTAVQVLEVEAVEDAPDVWAVVDTDHYAALAALHEVGHTLVFFKREVNAVARFGHKAGAASGLAGRVCRFAGAG